MMYIVQADTVAAMRRFPARSIQLIVTDPSYASLEKWRAIGTTTRLKSKTYPVFPDEDYGGWFADCYRALDDDAHMYVMTDDKTSYTMVPAAKRAGFHLWNRLVWDKGHIGTGYHWRHEVEYILFFEKGKRRLNNATSWGNMIRNIPPISRRTHYPTEKPVALFERLVLNSSKDGDLVVDPFCGSGASGIAALKHGRLYCGIDIAPEACAHARGRLAAASLGIAMIKHIRERSASPPHESCRCVVDAV